MFNIPSFFGFRAGGEPPLPLLNLFPGAAAAYSLRLLDSTYLGSAIQVRESTNNTTLDIGFVNGELDTASLLAHCAGANGFVTEWFDQSGNANNATQGVALSQPQIVSSGSVLLKYGKPNLQFTSNFLNLSSTLILNDQLTMCIVMNSSSVGGASTGFINYNSNPKDDPELRIGVGNELNDYYNGGYAITLNINAIVGGLFYYQRIGSYTSSIFRNSNFIASGTRSGALASGLQKFTIGEYLSNTRNGNISEFIIYASDQSANQTGIETNINDFYSIY